MNDFILFSKEKQSDKLTDLLQPYFNDNISIKMSDTIYPRSNLSYDQRVDFCISINDYSFSAAYNYYRNIVAYSIKSSQYHHLSHFEKMKQVYKTYLKVLDDYKLLHLDVNTSKIVNSFPDDHHYCFSFLNYINIENVFVDSPLDNLRSMSKLSFTFNEKSVYLNFYFESQQFELLYYLHKKGKNSQYVITKKLISTDFYAMFEEMVYDYYLKDEYTIKKRTSKQMNLIKMIRY